MSVRGQVTDRELALALETARRLVDGHRDPSVSPSERLREIAKGLGVTRIEGGAADASGFLAEEEDGTFGVFYNADHMPERRRFTVAHELAHLILNKSHKHLLTKQAQHLLARRGYRARRFQQATRHTKQLERAVDRIAAELLMPTGLVMPLMRDACGAERERSPSGLINKRGVLNSVRTVLGVSELALVLRLQELPELLAARFEFHWAERGLFRQTSKSVHRLGAWSSHGLCIESYPDPSQSDFEGNDGWELPVRVRMSSGEKRTIRCQAWRRSRITPETGLQVTWAVGWTWNESPIPKHDDSER